MKSRIRPLFVIALALIVALALLARACVAEEPARERDQETEAGTDQVAAAPRHGTTEPDRPQPEQLEPVAPEAAEGWPADVVALANEVLDARRDDTHKEGALIVVEPYGPELIGPLDLWGMDLDIRKKLLAGALDRPLYGVLPMQLFQVNPERTEVVYDMSIYELADAIVTSTAVKSRYLTEPERFAGQVAFYHDLEARFKKEKEFRPTGGDAPTVTVYTNPRQTTPFALRKNVTPAPVLKPSRHDNTREAVFYVNLGLNYETFGHHEEGYGAYSRASRYPMYEPRVFHINTMGIARCLVAMGRADDAARHLEQAASKTNIPGYREQFLQVRQQILQGK